MMRCAASQQQQQCGIITIKAWPCERAWKPSIPDLLIKSNRRPDSSGWRRHSADSETVMFLAVQILAGPAFPLGGCSRLETETDPKTREFSVVS